MKTGSSINQCAIASQCSATIERVHIHHLMFANAVVLKRCFECDEHQPLCQEGSIHKNWLLPAVTLMQLKNFYGPLLSCVCSTKSAYEVSKPSADLHTLPQPVATTSAVELLSDVSALCDVLDAKICIGRPCPVSCVQEPHSPHVAVRLVCGYVKGLERFVSITLF